MSNIDKSLDDIIRSKPNRNMRTKARKTPYNKKEGKGGTDGCSVYVGNLSYSTDWMQLKDIMREAGEVEFVDIFTRPDDGRSRGCAVVEFKTPEDAQNAIATLNDRTIDGRQIFLREDREPRRRNAGDGAGGYGGGYDGGNWDQPVHSSSSNLAQKIRANAAPNCTVKITNIPPAAAWQELKDLCVPYGGVERADTEQSGSDERFGIVVFSNAAGAAKCLAELDGATYEDHTLGVQLYTVPNIAGGGMGRGRPRLASRLTHRGQRPVRGGGYAHKVFIGNLPWNVEWQDLKDLCKEYGPVAFVDIPKNPQGRPKGFGLVRFENAQGAQNCISRLNGMLLDGRELEVRHDNQG